jgi:hypothetical protein
VRCGHDGSDAPSPHPGDPLGNISGLREHLTAIDNVIHRPQSEGFGGCDLSSS